MADVTLTITLPDIEAHAFATVVASPQVEANMIDLMGEAAERVYEALADAGFDVLTRMGPR